METKQKELFNNLNHLKSKIKNLSTYFQNDFQQMLNEGYITTEELIQSKEDINKDFKDTIDELKALNYEAIELIHTFVNKN